MFSCSAHGPAPIKVGEAVSHFIFVYVFSYLKKVVRDCFFKLDFSQNMDANLKCVESFPDPLFALFAWIGQEGFEFAALYALVGGTPQRAANRKKC